MLEVWAKVDVLSLPAHPNIPLPLTGRIFSVGATTGGGAYSRQVSGSADGFHLYRFIVDIIEIDIRVLVLQL